MDFSKMTIAELEARKAAIAAEIDTEGADLDALETEARAIKTEVEKRKAAAAKKAEVRGLVAGGAGVPVAKVPTAAEKHGKTRDEVRSSKEYMNAYANYIKTGRDTECRAILTENAEPGEGVTVSGPVPVPQIVEETVHTAWENNELLNRVRKTNFKGNLRVAFELDATEAAIHEEGAAGPDEEELQLGIVTMVPKNIKKWIRISDEAVTMGGEAFLRYIYDELTYRILKKLADGIVEKIVANTGASTDTQVGVPTLKAAPGLATIAGAVAMLSAEAENPVIIMNRLTEVVFFEKYADAKFAVDPFAGLPRVYTNALPAVQSTTLDEGDVYAIVGDLNAVQVNYPDGEGVAIKYDDLSEAENDMVKIVGRQYAAFDVTAPGKLVAITNDTPGEGDLAVVGSAIVGVSDAG